MSVASLEAQIADSTRLRSFVRSLAALLETSRDERTILDGGAALLRDLISRDDWLPDDYARASTQGYTQYLLHCDSRERFSVVSFVWGPGQSTPIHDHRIWGLVGVLRGAERVEQFARSEATGLTPVSEAVILREGDIDSFSPRIGDIHRVSNAYDDRVSVSIHIYGANIGAVERHTYDEAGDRRRFISGYANETLPNLWNASSSQDAVR